MQQKSPWIALPVFKTTVPVDYSIKHTQYKNLAIKNLYAQIPKVQPVTLNQNNSLNLVSFYVLQGTVYKSTVLEI